jgi:hypothetical protein
MSDDLLLVLDEAAVSAFRLSPWERIEVRVSEAHK